MATVWLRRPEVPQQTTGDPAVEAFVAAEWEALVRNLGECFPSARWVNPGWANSRAEQRLLQLQLAAACGLRVPKTLVTTSVSDARDFVRNSPNGAVAKRLGQQRRSGDPFLVFTSLITEEDLAGEAVRTPMLLQSHEPKRRDIRVTIVGKRVFAAAIESQVHPEASVDWRRAGQELEHRAIDLPAETSAALVELVQRLDLSFAAIDLIERADGTLTFLELNPNGQWAWIEERASLPISDAIVELLTEQEST